MNQVTVTVIKDKENFYPAGCNRLISCPARVMGQFFIASENTDPACIADTIYAGDIVKVGEEGGLVAPIAVVRILDPVHGNLWVAETRSELMGLCNALNCCPDSVFNDVFNDVFAPAFA
jgi:hypothetical protein